MSVRALHFAGMFVAACVCGVTSGLFGIGGGVLLVPSLILIFAYGQHRAQGTSLVTLVPPTGLLAFLTYAKAGYVSWKIGLILIPGVFAGATLGGWLAKRLHPRRMRQVFAGLMFALGLWQAVSAWRR
ncbi:MAG: sulfite exporter TauE/SafE family protein [Candidatus Acidiferrum sp.]